jgi:micrococcal nuclease
VKTTGKKPGRNKRILKAIAGTGIAGIFLAGLIMGKAGTVQPETQYKVVEIVDGDTFFIANRQPIRLYGLDAPELTNCYGEEAKKALARLILNKKVELGEILKEARGSRILAMVYADGKLINEELIKNGFARYRGQGNTATKTLKDAGKYARESRLGIYGPKCYQKLPPDQKCAIKGNIDHINKDIKNYYPTDCKYYNEVEMELFLGDTWFCTEKEAKLAGFMKAKTCE